VTPERWRQVTNVFHAAIGRRDALARDALLDEACAGDATLRAEVEALLAAHREAGPFGERPLVAFPAVSDPAGTGELDIPPYRLLRRIGQGGMGVVYEAEQLSPVRRKVALKLVRSGWSTDHVIARFESERQALALMNHPNIASVYEAGAAPDGRPYFAMELVPGSPVTEFCDEHQLPTRQRLELFLPICEGVQHAHQKGVIHRDIKPSNVLVARHEGRPVPKVIDFGVAKAISSTLTDRTLLTEAGQLVGTPGYMSPEQAEMANQDIDTRTDVYSLGVLLYELLAGVLPFGGGRDGVDLDELRRRIREDDPLPPSARVRRSADAAAAAARATDLGGLARQLKGDLDWIVLKALAKERSARYESPGALALDLRRHLEDRPIQARAPSRRYAVWKFVRRHRVGVTAAALVVAAILAGALLATAGLIRARRAEREARAEAAKAVAINRFLQETLGSAHPVLGRGRDATVRQALGVAVGKADQAFREQPEVLAALLNTVGRTYVVLGGYEEADPLLRRALELRQRAPHVPPADVAESVMSLGVLRFSMGRYDEAESLFRDALARHRSVFGDEHLAVSESLNDLAMTLQRKNRDYAAAKPLLEESLAIRTRLLGERHVDIAQSLNNLGMLYYRMGDLAGAEPLFRRAMSLNRELLGPQHVELATNWSNLARLLRDKGELVEAEQLFRQVLDADRRLLGADHPYVASGLRDIASVLVARGTAAEAERLYRDALAIQQKRFPAGHWEIARTRSELGGCVAARGDYAAAEPLLLGALPALERGLGAANPSTQAARRRVVDLYERWGRPERAEPHRAELMGAGP
jgi:serine/threonine protein kinase/Tfp pilus assembly protein PilF